MKYFLQGGGSFPNSKAMDDLFFQNIPSEKKMLYIPIAMTGQFTFDQCLSYIEKLAGNYGFNNIKMCTFLESLGDNDLEECGSIYIGGGNTFKLLNEIKKNNFDKQLIEFLKKGGVVCGGSAGAIIFGKEISTSADANIVKLQDTSGLNIVDGHSIWCHYNPIHDEEIKTYVDAFSTPVIALPENGGLYLEGGELKSMGQEEVYIFSCDNEKRAFTTRSIWRN